MKKYPVLTNCPVCDHDLDVIKLKCSKCDTEIEGNFTLSKFNYLDQEKLYFIEVFVKNRGNIKAIEKELNISYPTVKKMLDDVILGLGYQVEDIEEQNFSFKENIRKAVLDQLKEGKVSVEEALKKIKGEEK